MNSLCAIVIPGPNPGGFVQSSSSVEQESHALRNKMEPGISLTVTDVDNILAHVETAANITGYLASHSSSYTPDAGWSFIAPGDGAELEEKQIYDPLVKLINNILAYFNLYDENTRRVVNTASIGSVHSLVGSNIKLKESPNLFAMLQDGTYFPQDPVAKLTYDVCASPIEVKLDKNNEWEDWHWRAQCEFYASECFVHQPGRHFVFVPLITETRIRLYRFDRGGALVGPWINYHSRPEVMVRIMLLTCGQTGDRLGANPSMKWKGLKQYITIKKMGPECESGCSSVEDTSVTESYEIVKPLCVTEEVCGRGTCAWRVIDEAGKPCVVKYLWREETRSPEWEILERLRGLSGVVNILARSQEWSLFGTRNFRPETPFAGHDRMACFVVLDCYGPCITKFKSPIQFLECFRDAIKGHHSMWKRGVLHRDISINNILYGPEDAEDDDRGVVIDMDLAVFFDRTESLRKADWRTGTHAFQSVNVLESAQSAQRSGSFVPVHDYLDDLESFFWVFCWVIVGYGVLPNGNAVGVYPLPEVLHSLQAPIKFASVMKNVYLRDPTRIVPHSTWPGHFNALKTQMARFLDHYLSCKIQPPIGDVTRDSLAVPSECHYETFLAYIQEATDSLKADKPAKAPCTRMDFDFDKYDKQISRKKKKQAIESPPAIGVATLDTADLNTLPVTPLIRKSLKSSTDSLDDNTFGSSPLSSISSDDSDSEDVIPAILHPSVVHLSPSPADQANPGFLTTSRPLKPSQVTNLTVPPQRIEKRALDIGETPAKRLRTLTGSIRSPFHPVPNAPRS